MSIAACFLKAEPGSFVTAPVDVLMGHDGTASLVIDRFNKAPFPIPNPQNVFLVFDHFAPPATVERANIQNRLLRFAREQNLPYAMYTGICHQLLLEHPKVVPGALTVGADSHTTTAGALGSLATGVGATDFFNCLKTSEIWLRVPQTIAVFIRGRLRPFLNGKDIVLAIMREIGSDGANYKSLEFIDQTETGVPADERAAICNMAVDLGGKFGLFMPDAITVTSLVEKLPLAEADDLVGTFHERLKTYGAPKYEREIVIDLDELEPLLQAPNGTVAPVTSFAGTPVSQVFIGSCSAGRLADFERAVSVLQSHVIRPDCKMIVIPASRAILLEGLRLGYFEALIRSGAVMGNPSCGPCCNIDKGVLGDGETCISTSNRNFRGRMGANNSEVFIASAASAAAAAMEGKIADPRDFLS